MVDLYHVTVHIMRRYQGYISIKPFEATSQLKESNYLPLVAAIHLYVRYVV